MEHILGERIGKPEGERTDPHSPLSTQISHLILPSLLIQLHSRGQEAYSDLTLWPASLHRKTEQHSNMNLILILVHRILHWQENT